MTVTLTVDKNVYGGDGLGRLNDGRVVFVPDVWAGEKIRAEIVETKKNFVRAKCVEILEPSPDRIPAPAVRVPGMVYAELSYAAELRAKEEQLGNFLERVGLNFTRIQVHAGRSEAYRNKATYHTARAGGKWLVGYRKEFSHDVEDTPVDPLVVPEIAKELSAIRAGVTALLTQGSRQVRASAKEAGTVTVRHTKVDGVKWWLGDAPFGLELHEETAGKRFRVAAEGFYQVNPQVGDLLVKAVKAAYEEGAEDAPNVLDLYCGVGVFGLCCLEKAAHAEPGPAVPRLVGIESERKAIEAAKKNAEALGIRASFFCERVGQNLRRIKPGPRHTVIVDPPRGGLEPNVAPWLAQCGAKRIFYVSCDPATLTRDLEKIVRAYRVKRVQLFDMFPRTARFETFVELEKA